MTFQVFHDLYEPCRPGPALFSPKCSLLGTNDVRRQISEDLFSRHMEVIYYILVIYSCMRAKKLWYLVDIMLMKDIQWLP